MSTWHCQAAIKFFSIVWDLTFFRTQLILLRPINASLVSQKVTPRPKLLHACDRAFFGAFCRRCFVGFGVALPICGRIRPTSSPWVGSLRVGQLWPKVGGALAGAAEQQQVHFLEEKGLQVCDHSTQIIWLGINKWEKLLGLRKPTIQNLIYTSCIHRMDLSGFLKSEEWP